MIVRPMTHEDALARQRMSRSAEELKNAGVCPTCRHFETGGVYPHADARTFYEDETIVCMLEAFPRARGHAILLVKPHYEDVSELPLPVAMQLLPVVHAAIQALKSVLAAEKVYLCSMCDGKRNHFHLQLIPRLSGDNMMGSKRFVKPRGVLDGDYRNTVSQLQNAMRNRLNRMA